MVTSPSVQASTSASSMTVAGTTSAWACAMRGGHRAAHAAQRLERPGLGEIRRRPLDVRRGDHAVGPDGLTRARSTPLRRASARTAGVALTPTAAPARAAAVASSARCSEAGIAPTTVPVSRRGHLLECHERRADLDDVALGAEQLADAARPRRRHLDHRFVGLDRDQRLVGDHLIARPHVPLHDLGLLQALAEVGRRLKVFIGADIPQLRPAQDAGRSGSFGSAASELDARRLAGFVRSRHCCHPHARHDAELSSGSFGSAATERDADPACRVRSAAARRRRTPGAAQWRSGSFGAAVARHHAALAPVGFVRGAAPRHANARTRRAAARMRASLGR